MLSTVCCIELNMSGHVGHIYDAVPGKQNLYRSWIAVIVELLLHCLVVKY